MTKDEQKWIRLQELAMKMAKKELLETLLKSTGLDEYISSLINTHEQQYHDNE